MTKDQEKIKEKHLKASSEFETEKSNGHSQKLVQVKNSWRRTFYDMLDGARGESLPGETRIDFVARVYGIDADYLRQNL